jgi:hypothetical protein
VSEILTTCTTEADKMTTIAIDKTSSIKVKPGLVVW